MVSVVKQTASNKSAFPDFGYRVGKCYRLQRFTERKGSITDRLDLIWNNNRGKIRTRKESIFAYSCCNMRRDVETCDAKKTKPVQDGHALWNVELNIVTPRKGAVHTCDAVRYSDAFERRAAALFALKLRTDLTKTGK